MLAFRRNESNKDTRDITCNNLSISSEVLFIISKEVINIIRTLNLNRKTTAILENAYDIGYEKEVNAIWQAHFSLPGNDPKINKVELLEYVEIESDFYRIMPKLTQRNNGSESVTFRCEHVLSTLLDGCLFKYHQLSNYKTRDVIEYLLSQQDTKHWELRRCDFDRGFHYAWENENGLLAPLFSIPKPFNEPYVWQFDTSSYPWQLDLIKPSNIPTCRIKDGYNLLSLEIEENPMNVINRIYPLGAGEGVNQLTIDPINNGKPYLESREPNEEIKKYVWVDRRFTDIKSLKDSAQALLDEWKKPKITWQASAADVSSITGLKIDELICGSVVRLQIKGYPITDLRIAKVSKSDIKGNPGNVQLSIGNVAEDLATTHTDLERRQQVNELYSQGATNILNSDRTDNADPTHPIKFKVRIPEDAININFMELTWETNRFRGYTKGSSAGGHFQKESTVVTKSTGNGGAFTKPSTIISESTLGGGGETTEDGGGTTATSEPPNTMDFWEDERKTSVVDGHYHTYRDNFWDIEAIGKHKHQVIIGTHTHKTKEHKHNFEVTIPKIEIPKHEHEFDVTIPAIEIQDHSHEQIYGIYEHDKLPTKLEVKVDGNIVPITTLSATSVDLTPFLARDGNDRVQRNRFATVEIRPTDELAQISANIIWGLFIQSHKGQKL